jgi:predicted AAA+ superfamily ATPase
MRTTSRDVAAGHNPGKLYLPRIVDGELTAALWHAGAILIEGPKAVGKTSTASRAARTIVHLDDVRDDRIADAIDNDLGLLLTGETPVLLDEWQMIPHLWNRVRHEVDDRAGAPGQFILAGSSTPDDSVRRHSGAGRFRMIQIRPMSLYESGRSTGAVSLAGLFAGDQADVTDPGWSTQQARADMAEAIIIGGWPQNIARPPRQAAAENVAYLDIIREVDIASVTGVRRDPVTTGRVIRSVARHIATPASLSTIARDAAVGEVEGEDATSRVTVRDHLAALARLRIVEEQPAWSPHLRSAAAVRTSSKRHFVDPCLAAAALSASPSQLLDDPKTFGLWFESLVVRDLRVYAQPLRGKVYHYRDSDHLEVDIIVELFDGRWAGIEVKLGSTKEAVDPAARSLITLRDRVGPGRCAFLAVVNTGAGAYRRADGVLVIPASTLGP